MMGAAPRALIHRRLITVEITPTELHRLVVSIETDALAAIEDGRDDFADYLLSRVAQLREAGR